MGLQTYNGSVNTRKERKYLSAAATITLRKGQILVYLLSATTNNTDPKLRLGNNVTDLATGFADNAASINCVSGIVPDSEAGKTGTNFVELDVPVTGDVLEVETDGSGTAVVVGDLLKPSNTQTGCLIKGAAGDGLVQYRALQATSAARATIYVVKL